MRGSTTHIRAVTCSKPHIRRRAEILFHAGILMGVIAALLLSAVGSGSTSGTPRVILICVIALGLAGSIGALVASVWSARRVLARIESSEYLVCAHCGHDLRGVPSGSCPACGVPVRNDELRSFWMRYVRAHHHFGLESRAPVPRWLARVGLQGVAALAVVWAVLLLGAVVASIHLPALGVGLTMLVGFFIPWSMRACSGYLAHHACARLIDESDLICTECGSRLASDGAELVCSRQRCGRRFPVDQLAQIWAIWRPPCWSLEGVHSTARESV